MSCNNNINYDTFSFHKEKIINSIYEENVQVIFREKFNQILQKIKNVEVRNWFIEELTQRLGDKSYVYDKMSIIESLDFIEKECFGIKNIQNISNQEEEDEEDEEDDEDDEEDEEDEEEDEEDEEEDEDEIKETFIGNIFNNVFEGFKIKNVFEGFKIKKKFKKAKKSVSKKVEPVSKPISKNVIAPISKNVAPIVEPISKNIKPVSSKNKKKKKKKKQKKKTNRYYSYWDTNCLEYNQEDGTYNIKSSYQTPNGEQNCEAHENAIMDKGNSSQKNRLCQHCELPSGYHNSGYNYDPESRNKQDKMNNVCGKCILENDYYCKPIDKVTFFEGLTETVIYLGIILLLIISSIFFKIFRNLNFINESINFDNNEAQTRFTFFRLISCMLKKPLSKNISSNNPQNNFFKENSEIIENFFTLLLFTILSSVFTSGFYSSNQSYSGGIMNVLTVFLTIFLMVCFSISVYRYFSFILSCYSILDPKRHPYIAWYLVFWITGAIYIFSVIGSVFTKGLCTKFKDITSIGDNITCISKAFISSLLKPLEEPMRIFSQTDNMNIKNSINIMLSLFFYLLKSSGFVWLFIIMFSTIISFDFTQIFSSMSQQINSINQNTSLMSIILLCTIIFGIIWITASKNKICKKYDNNKFTLIHLQTIVPVSLSLFTVILTNIYDYNKNNN